MSLVVSSLYSISGGGVGGRGGSGVGVSVGAFAAGLMETRRLKSSKRDDFLFMEVAFLFSIFRSSDSCGTSSRMSPAELDLKSFFVLPFFFLFSSGLY